MVAQVKSVVAGRRDTEFTLSADSTGLHKNWLMLENLTGSDHLKWDEIVSVKVFKRDLFNVDCICMAFETTANNWLEIHEDMKGWKELIDILPLYLTGITNKDDWWSQVAFPAFETNEHEIFRRKAQQSPAGDFATRAAPEE